VLPSSHVRAWHGRLPLRREPFFDRLVHVGRKYPDSRGRGRQSPVSEFTNEIVGLREAAPSGAQVLIDELVHRWVFPTAPPSLYVLECSASFVTPNNGESADPFEMTKIGQAARSLAPRFTGYTDVGMTDLFVVPESISLRVLIYGHGSAMPIESEMKQAAARQGAKLRRWAERFDGFGLADPLAVWGAQRETGQPFAVDIFHGDGSRDEKRALLRSLTGSDDERLGQNASAYLKSLDSGAPAST
jgi:hypothetical protein